MEEFTNRLKLIADIRGAFSDFKGFTVDLPEVCVIGKQGAGKTSLLGKLFPGLDEVLPSERRNGQAVTTCPIRITFKKSADTGLFLKAHGEEKIAFDWTTEGRESAKQLVLNWKETKPEHNFNEVDVDQVKEIEITILHPDALDMSLVDLPGLVAPTDLDDKIPARVEALVERYIKNKLALIVFVYPAQDERATLLGKTLLNKIDKERTRTMDVLTMMDSVHQNTPSFERVLSSLRGGRIKSLVVCTCPGNGLTEETFFGDVAFDGVRERCGSQKFMANVQPQLAKCIEDNLSNLNEKLKKIHDDAQNWLSTNGETPKTGNARAATLKDFMYTGIKNLPIANTYFDNFNKEIDAIVASEVNLVKLRPLMKKSFNAVTAPYYQGHKLFDETLEKIGEDSEKKAVILAKNFHDFIVTSVQEILNEFEPEQQEREELERQWSNWLTPTSDAWHSSIKDGCENFKIFMMPGESPSPNELIVENVKFGETFDITILPGDIVKDEFDVTNVQMTTESLQKKMSEAWSRKYFKAEYQTEQLFLFLSDYYYDKKIMVVYRSQIQTHVKKIRDHCVEFFCKLSESSEDWKKLIEVCGELERTQHQRGLEKEKREKARRSMALLKAAS